MTTGWLMEISFTLLVSCRIDEGGAPGTGHPGHGARRALRTYEKIDLKLSKS